jgi:hypothetical protein
MPALPSAKLQSLKSAAKGSFVTVKNPKDTMEFGLRAALAPVEKSDKEEPVFVKLTPRAGGRCEAQLVSSGPRLPNEWIVGSSTRVVNHTNDWTLQVLAKDWDADVHETTGTPMAHYLREGVRTVLEKQGVSVKSRAKK